MDDKKASAVEVYLENVNITERDYWETIVDFQSYWSTKFYEVIGSIYQKFYGSINAYFVFY